MRFSLRCYEYHFRTDDLRQLEGRGLDDTHDLLTDRKREILQLVAEGRTNKEVLRLLNVSVAQHFWHEKRPKDSVVKAAPFKILSGQDSLAAWNELSR